MRFYLYDDDLVETFLQTTTIDGFRYLGSTGAHYQFTFMLEGLQNIVQNLQISYEVYEIIKRFINQGERQPYIEKQSSQSSTDKRVARSQISDKSISANAAEQMDAQCGRIYDDIIQLSESSNNQYKRFGIKLKKICQKYKKEEEKENELELPVNNNASQESRARRIRERKEKIANIKREFLGKYNVVPIPKHQNNNNISKPNPQPNPNNKNTSNNNSNYENQERLNYNVKCCISIEKNIVWNKL